jgi:hypothetical protein
VLVTSGYLVKIRGSFGQAAMKRFKESEEETRDGTEQVTLRMNLGALPLARCGLESDSASKMEAWSVPWSKI